MLIPKQSFFEPFGIFRPRDPLLVANRRFMLSSPEGIIRKE